MSKIASACPGVQSRRFAEQRCHRTCERMALPERHRAGTLWPMKRAASTRPRTVSCSTHLPRGLHASRPAQRARFAKEAQTTKDLPWGSPLLAQDFAKL